ncbi:MAG TPA: LysR family transcriptional regulator [Pseudonocardia sp.]
MADADARADDPVALARVFLAVYREGSAGTAGRELGLSQSTVSRQIAALESRLGTPLFVRRPHGFEPTPAGHRLATRIEGPVSAVVREIGAARRIARPITVGSSADLLASIAVPALVPLIADGTAITLRPGLPDELAPAAMAGELDVLVLPSLPARIARRFQITPLLKETFLLVAAPRWAAGLPAERSARWAAVRRTVPFLALGNPPPMSRRWWRVAAGLSPPAPRLVFADARALRDAAVLGAGAVVLPQFLLLDQLASGALVELVAAAEPVVNQIHLAHRTDPRTEATLAPVLAALQGVAERLHR